MSKNFRSRLDRFLSQHLDISINRLRAHFAAKYIRVNEIVETRRERIITAFDKISYRGTIIQDNQPVYYMLNKSAGIVSATADKHSPVVTDLIIPKPNIHLIIAGRLDKFSTGLILLSNDARWCERMSHAKYLKQKKYIIQTLTPMDSNYIQAFFDGMVLENEVQPTRSATLTLLDGKTHAALCQTKKSCHAQVILTEGKYHQIKRMIGAFRNQIISIHRVQMGAIILDERLAPNEYRSLSAVEIESAFSQ